MKDIYCTGNLQKCLSFRGAGNVISRSHNIFHFQVHGDVFRPASHPMLFSALIGTGYHISFVSFLVIIVAILGELYTERGSMVSTSIFVYAATGPINGYFGGSLYARMGGKIWIKQVREEPDWGFPILFGVSLSASQSHNHELVLRFSLVVHELVLRCSDDPFGFPAARVGLWNGFLHQLHRHLLSRVARHSLRHHGGRHLHLSFRHSPADVGRNHFGAQPGGHAQLSLSH